MRKLLLAAAIVLVSSTIRADERPLALRNPRVTVEDAYDELQPMSADAILRSGALRLGGVALSSCTIATASAGREIRKGEAVITSSRTATSSVPLFSLSAGILGGALLIMTQALVRRAPMIYLPYAVVVVVTAVWLRIDRVQPFARRWLLSLGTFMVSTLILYLYIGLRSSHTLFKISLLGHAWRLGLMLAIGAVISGAVAFLTTAPDRDPASGN